jgi:hypothetical protein
MIPILCFIAGLATGLLILIETIRRLPPRTTPDMAMRLLVEGFEACRVGSERRYLDCPGYADAGPEADIMREYWRGVNETYESALNDCRGLGIPVDQIISEVAR